MGKNLVIVESPAKAKTIEGYLGKDFQVKSSYGHVRDLPKNDSAIDLANDFKPTYEISKDKKEIVKELKALAKKAEIIYLASDDDREGEAISWHLSEALNLDGGKTRRIIFREITKNAIKNAIENPRGIDIDLVNAQQARRILDRLVGFELSPILWKKIKGGLSAGRVQSVAVRLVVERERELAKFNPVSSFRVMAEFNLDGGKVLKAELPKKFPTEDESTGFMNQCNGADFIIEDLKIKPGKKSPAPPFTTSTLQQEASRKLGYSVARTMSVAQKLYEAGKISYMRTDSLHLSDEALNGAASAIQSTYGDDYAKRRTFKTKNASAQEAHEAIRPTDFGVQKAGKAYEEHQLYELIWKRTIASQMSEAKLEKTIATVGISGTEEKLVAKGEVVQFSGFLKVYIESTDDEEGEEENRHMLPPLTVGQKLDFREMLAKQVFTRHSPRYTEASLVKKLEEMGIGRPSTYAPTISTIQKRTYVEKDSREGAERISIECLLKDGKIKVREATEITGAEKHKLFPTNTAMVVNDFLVDHFPSVIDYRFTADVEQQFDDIAHGKTRWNKMIDDFYRGFHSTVEKSASLDRAFVNQVRELGEDAETEKKIYAKHGKYGAYVQKGELVEGEEKPQYASLKNGQFMDSIKMEEAMELFKLPREVGFFEDKPIVATVGRYGPYIRYDEKFVSLKKEQDPLSITEAEAIELIHEKREADIHKYIKTFDEDSKVFVLNGKYGPYIKFGSKNIKIPKNKKPEDLTFEECKVLAEKAPDKKGKKGQKRRTFPTKK